MWKDRAVSNPPYNYNFLPQAPALPDRYVKHEHMTRSRENLASEIPEYLEPLPEPRSSSKASSNAGSSRSGGGGGSGRSRGGGGGGGSGRIRAEGPYQVSALPGVQPGRGGTITRPEGSVYFSRMDRSASQDEDGGYDTLGKKALEAKENSGDSGLGSTGNREPEGRGIHDDHDGDGDNDSYQGNDSYQDFEKEPLHTQEAAGDRDSNLKEPKYFVLEPQADSNNRDSAKDSTVDETEPLNSPKTPPAGGEPRPRRYRPKRPHQTRNDTVV